jgi:hypothetical protein
VDAVIVALSVLLAATFGVSGVAMVRARPLMGSAVHRAMPSPVIRSVGMLELCASAGLIAGVFTPAAGAVAAGLLAALSLGAIPVHFRVDDSLAVIVAGSVCAGVTLGLLALYVVSGAAAPL